VTLVGWAPYSAGLILVIGSDPGYVDLTAGLTLVTDPGYWV